MPDRPNYSQRDAASDAGLSAFQQKQAVRVANIPHRRPTVSRSNIAPMIEIATYADLHRNGYTLAYHCWRCRRWSDVDLAAIVAAGRGGQAYVGKRPRCIDCGEHGSMQIQPPHRRIGERHANLRTSADHMPETP